MNFIYNDGGRAAAGYKGHTGDCVTRAVAIASGRPYQEIYEALAMGNVSQRRTRKSKTRKAEGQKTAAKGISVRRKWFKDYMRSLGFRWVPCMGIGTGCTVHLSGDNSELPNGRLIVAVSKHYTAVIDRVINDTYNPQRDTHVTEYRNGEDVHSIQRRCVYGYWILNPIS